VKPDVAVVTGGSAGIGRATAQLLAERGSAVVVADLDERGGAEVIDVIRRAGGRGTFVALDVSDEDAVDKAFSWIDGNVGPTGVLVNCAGGSHREDGPVHALEPGVLDATLAVDLRGTVLCAGAAVLRMRRLGRGAIVNLSSFHALGGDSPGHAYAAAKGAVISLTRTMAAHYAVDGVRVNAVAPGIVLTQRVRRRIEEDGIDLADVQARHPFAVGEPETIARIVAFLTSDDARMITGCTLPADGGLTLY
jgi:NAD(P)-dependent dehydrogenase (short-subunit alcohol dehydrogenase family)